jgi:uncharacterized membrane protein YkoI
MIRKITLSLVALSLASAAAIGYAANRQQDNDASALPTAKITLSQAIANAEQHAAGHATRAELEQTKAGPAYDVEIVNGKDVVDVRIHADTGAVIASARDTRDEDDTHDTVD